ATMRTRICVSPSPLKSGWWPACRWLSLMTSSRSGAKAAVNFSLMLDFMDMADLRRRKPCAAMHKMVPQSQQQSALSILVAGPPEPHNGAMKLDSKYFDRIRTKRRVERPERSAPTCQWDGCEENAVHRAPVGRSAEGQC